MSKIREALERAACASPNAYDKAVFDWMVQATADLEAKGCGTCGNVRNRADNSYAFCPHCRGIDAKGGAA